MFKKKTEDEILKLLAEKSKENIKVLKDIEKSLIKNRGYIFKMPKPGTPVAVSLSGGADSVITTAILMKDYGLKVYPFFIKRGQRSEKYELSSVEFFSDIFKKQFPDLYNDPLIIAVPNPATEIKPLLTDDLIEGTGYPMRNSILVEYGVQYAFGMAKKGIKIRDIFCSFVSCDGDFGAQTTLTGLRSLMHHVCVDMGDMSWQISALPIEKELGFYLDKDDLLKWADCENLPVEKTRSCFEDQNAHCGICYACKHRKKSFEDAGIDDKTIYLDARSSKK